MARILLVRHGQSEWNADGRWQGQADPPLSELGEEQAVAAARALGMVDAIYASDLVRAHHTAELVAAQIGSDVVVAPNLRERSAGEWEGRTRAEINERWPGYLESGRRPAGYEPDDSVLERVPHRARSHRGERTTATCSWSPTVGSCGWWNVTSAATPKA